MLQWVKKVWGKTREIIQTPYYSNHELQLIAGTYCSLHYHQHRANKFHVLNACVEIIEMYGPSVVRTMLGPDNTYIVPSLVPHMFVVYKSGIMIEEYYPDRGGIVLQDDIVRIVEGGSMQINDLPNLPFIIINFDNRSHGQ